MRFALLQCDSKVGDVTGNAARILDLVHEAADRGAEVCVTPELALCGYPPKDLLSYPAFIDAVERAERDLAKALAGRDVALVLGTLAKNPASDGKKVFNQAAFLHGGKVLVRYSKRLTPFYEVFDEERYFEPGTEPCVVIYKEKRLALCVCEDIWNNATLKPVRHYALDPIAACPPFDVLVNLSASPFSQEKQALREETLSFLAREYDAAVLYTNAVGGNDDLVFDGRSTCFMPGGVLAARGKAFAEDIVLCDVETGAGTVEDDVPSPEPETWSALTLGVRDYCRKTGMRKVVLGLSGGVDSALVAAIACEALGPENVLGALMPSPFSSGHSITDAEALAENLGMETVILPIEPAMRAYDGILAPAFAGRGRDTTEENLQARIRGALLMALSNKFGSLLLTTGNKSEMAVGYCTLYGDMCGALAVIGDVYKTDVYALCRWRNECGAVIPESILEKAPSAELRPGQRDRDSLPPYDKLDTILRCIIENRMSVHDICAKGYKPEIVRGIATLVAKAEFKRRQAPIVIKTSRNAFGPGWRMPVACTQAYLL